MPDEGRASTRRCVLHIGMNKTGSSSIQATGREHAEVLRDRFDLDYYTGLRQHSLLAGLFMDDPTRYAAVCRQVGADDQLVARWRSAELERLEAAIDASRHGCFVISGEGLSTMGIEEVRRMAAFLTPRFDRVEVYMYLREPFAYARSKAQQNIKSGVTFAQMRRANLDEPVAAPREPDGQFSPAIQPFYRQRIEPALQHYGVDNVHLRQFDPALFPDGDVVLDFFDWIGAFDLGSAGVAPCRINESIDDRSLRLIEAANRTAPPFHGRHRNSNRSRSLTSLLAVNDGSSFGFPDFNTQRFAEVIRSDVMWLADTTAGRFEYSLDPPPVWEAEPDRSPPERAAQRLNRRLLQAERDRISARVLDLLLAADAAEADERAALLDQLEVETGAIVSKELRSRVLAWLGANRA